MHMIKVSPSFFSKVYFLNWDINLIYYNIIQVLHVQHNDLVFVYTAYRASLVAQMENNHHSKSN